MNKTFRGGGITGRALCVVCVLIVLSFVTILTSAARLGAGRSDEAVGGRWGVSPAEALSEPVVSLSAASGETVGFQPGNGRATGGSKAEAYRLPFLVLARNGRLTSAPERTLVVQVAGLDIPSPGVTVTLLSTTMHGDPDAGPKHGRPIIVWRESRWVPAATPPVDANLVFTRTFTDLISSRTSIPTPTDYFGYKVTVTAPDRAKPLYRWQQDPAFLMENQWTAPLNLEGIAGSAAPPGLIIHYADMFPLRQDIRRPTTWIRRTAVTDFVGRELVPIVQRVFRVETQGWGFRWHPAWTSYRQDLDGDLLSIALSDGRTWFHSHAPIRGHAGISINTNGGRSQYDRLVDGLLSTLYHELLHNLQRNIYQHQEGNGDIEGYRRRWAFVSEGTAVLASSVGQPRIQWERSASPRAYPAKVRAFLGDQQVLDSDLNTSYADLPGSYGAVYWRFLYEQCGGMKNGLEDPATGMTVIRRVLQSVYSADVIDISSPADVVTSLPAVIDHALGDPAATSCPFRTHRSSLIAFARALYGLRLQQGRCQEPGLPAGCGFYDPHELYPSPPADVIHYTGTPITHTAAVQLYPAGVPNSFGIDLIEIELDPAVDGQSLTIDFRPDPTAVAEFHLQLGALSGRGAGDRWSLVDPFEAVSVSDHPDQPGSTIGSIDTDRSNRLALIITRLDSTEGVDPRGAYTLILRPGID